MSVFMLKMSWKAYKLRNTLGNLSYENLKHWINENTKYSVEAVNEKQAKNQLKNVIFVDENMENSEAAEFLICEIGYIFLEDINSKLNEDEKEKIVGKFVSLVYNPKKIPYFLYSLGVKKLWLYAILTVILVQSVFCVTKYRLETAVANPVYITQDSNKYHTKACGSIKNSKKTALEKTEAEKIFEKCNLCNPK